MSKENEVIEGSFTIENVEMPQYVLDIEALWKKIKTEGFTDEVFELAEKLKIESMEIMYAPATQE